MSERSLAPSQQRALRAIVSNQVGRKYRRSFVDEMEVAVIEEGELYVVRVDVTFPDGTKESGTMVALRETDLTESGVMTYDFVWDLMMMVKEMPPHEELQHGQTNEC